MPIQSEQLFYLSCDVKGEDCEGFYKNEAGFTLKFISAKEAIDSGKKAGWNYSTASGSITKITCPSCQKSLTKSFQNATLEEVNTDAKD